MARHAPSREEVQNSTLLRPFGHRIRHSELWRFTRRSVPRGVAIGLFVGIFLMVPGLQIVGAALACMALRGNVPIAAAMTFLSNPATTPFFLVAAVNVGQQARLPRRSDDLQGAGDDSCKHRPLARLALFRRRSGDGHRPCGDRRNLRVCRILGVACRMALVGRAQVEPT